MRNHTDSLLKSKPNSKSHLSTKDVPDNLVSSPSQHPQSSQVHSAQNRRYQQFYNTLPLNRSEGISGSGGSLSQFPNLSSSYTATSTTTAGSGSLQRKAFERPPQFFSPPASSPHNRKLLLANPNVIRSNANMSKTEIESIGIRQKEILEELKSRRNVLQRKIASLKAHNERQTDMLLRDTRTKDIKNEHIQLVQRVAEIRAIQGELDRAKRINSRLVSELSINKAQLVSKRAETSSLVQYMRLLTEKLELMHLWSQQAMTSMPASHASLKDIFAIETPGDRQSLLLSESVNIQNQKQWLKCVPSNSLSQLEALLQDRLSIDGKLSQLRLNHQQAGQYQMQNSSSHNKLSTDASSARGNGNTAGTVPAPISYAYSPRSLHSRSAVSSKDSSPSKAWNMKIGQPLPTLPTSTAPDNASSPPMPERRLPTPQLAIFQNNTVGALTGPHRNNNDRDGGTDVGSHLLNSPVAADLSAQELLIRPSRPPSIILKDGESHRNVPLSSMSVASNRIGSGRAASDLQNNDHAAGDKGATSSVSGPPVAPRVMRRASLLRYASNSFIRDTYFRGTRREELAKKYKESADAILQAKLTQLRLSSSPASTASLPLPSEALVSANSMESSMDSSEFIPPEMVKSTPVDIEEMHETTPLEEYEAVSLPQKDATLEQETALQEDAENSNAHLEVTISNEEDLNAITESGIEIDSFSPLISSDSLEKPSDEGVVLSSTTTFEESTDKEIVQLRSKNLPKGILRPREVPGSGRRIRFSPLTLLLDASLVGDLEMVKQVAMKVNDVSEPNEDGITALHNSICAGYDEISVFLVLQCAANVNAQELDGWTPLHCAAACGSVEMCRLLVEHGAALLLPTLEDGESALEKATNLARENGGFTGGHAACEEYLHFEVLRLWRMDYPTPLFALFDYAPQQEDELKMQRNEKLELVKANSPDDLYWCLVRNLETGEEGLVPKYFISRYPLLLEGASQLDPDSLCSP